MGCCELFGGGSSVRSMRFCRLFRLDDVCFVGGRMRPAVDFSRIFACMQN